MTDGTRRATDQAATRIKGQFSDLKSKFNFLRDDKLELEFDSSDLSLACLSIGTLQRCCDRSS